MIPQALLDQIKKAQQPDPLEKELSPKILDYIRDPATYPGSDADAAEEKRLLDRLGTLPSEAALQAGIVKAQQAGLEAQQQAQAGIPTPHEAGLPPYAMPDLALPTPPHPEQTSLQDVNPMAAVGAALGGLVSPSGAGQFLAGALQGTLAKVQQHNADASKLFQQEFQLQSALNQYRIRKSEADRETQIENNRIKYQSTLSDVQRQMADAERSGKITGLKAEAGAYTSQADADKERAQLDAQLKAVQERRKETLGAREKAMTAAQQLLGHIEANRSTEAYREANLLSLMQSRDWAHQDRGLSRGNLENYRRDVLGPYYKAGGAFRGTETQLNNQKAAGTYDPGKNTPAGKQKSLNQVKSDYWRWHGEVSRLYAARRTWMNNWRKNNPGAPASQMFADPTYKAEYEAPERAAHEKLDEAERRMNALQGGAPSASSVSTTSVPQAQLRFDPATGSVVPIH